MYKIFNDTGFQITLNNGLTISVQFGQYHYCDNNYSNNNDLSSSKTASVAVRLLRLLFLEMANWSLEKFLLASIMNAHGTLLIQW